MQRFLIILSASFLLLGCKSALVGLDYASTSIGTHNGGKFEVGKVFKWIPDREFTLDQATVVADKRVDANPDTKDRATSVRGWVTQASFDASSDQVASIELNATRNTVIEYEDYTIHESDDTRGAMAEYINANPQAVAMNWGLENAIASIEDDAIADIYYVTVFKTITTSCTSLAAGSEAGGETSVSVPGLNGDVSVSFENIRELLCEGTQRCFFDVRIYEAYKNNDGNYDFKQTARRTKREFFADLRVGLN